MYRYNNSKTMHWNVTSTLCTIIACVFFYIVNDANASPLFGQSPEELDASSEQDNLFEPHDISLKLQPTSEVTSIEQLFQEPKFNPIKKDEKLQGYGEIMDLGEPKMESQLQRSFRIGRTSLSECIAKGFCRNLHDDGYCKSTCKRIYHSETSFAFHGCKIECYSCRHLRCG